MAKKVYLYLDPGNSMGKKMKEFLWSKGINFIELDLAKDPAAREAVKKFGFTFTPGIPIPPIAQVDGQTIIGMDLYAFDKLLRSEETTPRDSRSKPGM
ncbi:MAG: hypothetical protein EXR59_00780 [Dehalococcoidia bacterium]|nr:hypothetical protein [Dehalococcoidia bacterium]